MKVLHYAATRPTEPKAAFALRVPCGKTFPHLVTTDRAEVTCKGCLASLAKRTAKVPA